MIIFNSNINGKIDDYTYVNSWIAGFCKSTYARILKEVSEQPRPVILEADQYFIDDNGNYTFKLLELPYVHIRCQRLTRQYLSSGIDVIVANTFTRKRELQPYFEIADYFKADIKILTCTGVFKNIHDVSSATIEKMT